MAMKRRGFLRVTLRALIAAPLAWCAERVVPARYTEALRARFYPGPLQDLDKSELRRPARWAG